jgi:hypothetical protein
MDYFAGLDVSVKETSVCIVDDAGKIVRPMQEKPSLASSRKTCSTVISARSAPARRISAMRAAMLPFVEFAGHEVAVPGQDGVRPGDIGHLAENLAAQSMTDFAERGSLRVRELQPPLRLAFLNTVRTERFDQVLALRPLLPAIVKAA